MNFGNAPTSAGSADRRGTSVIGPPELIRPDRGYSGASSTQVGGWSRPILAELVIFTPEQVWHWPDLADPGTLAGYVRQAIAAADSGGLPPEAS